jgi:hypothetical protein
MPFEKFVPPKLHAAIGSTVGKAQGVIIAKVQKEVFEATNKMRAKGCPSPAELSKVKSKLAGVKALSGTLTSSVASFKAIPASIKAPVGGIKSALKIILALPIPQSVPPGFGIPVNISMKFADIMNFLKEFIAAAEITANAIELPLNQVDASLQAINSRVKDLEVPVRACEINQILEEQLSSGSAQALGLLDKDGNLITSTLGSLILEEENTRPASDQVKLGLEKDLGLPINLLGALSGDDLSKIDVDLDAGDTYRITPPGSYKDSESGLTKDFTGSELAVFDGNEFIIVENDSLKPGGLTGKNQALAQFELALNNISDRLNNITEGLSNNTGMSIEQLENLRDSLLELSADLQTTEGERIGSDDLSYKGYTLRIVRDPQSPKLAPRHFAIGLKNGEIAIKGPSSFSSSKEVLIDEIKFRIDNQLS